MCENRLIIDALAYKKGKAYGFQEYLFNLLDYFYKHKNLISAKEIIIVCDKSQQEAFKQYADSFQIKRYATPNLFIRFIVQTLYPYTMNLDKNDLVLYTGNFTSFFKKSKSLLVIHDLLYLRKYLLPNKLMRLQRKIYIPRSLKIADKVVAISDFTKNDILNHFNFVPENKIERIYNYFNFEKYNITSHTLERSIDGEFFLCVSSLLKHKNIITILKAFVLFSQINKKIDLVLVGSLQKGSYLDEYIKQLDLDTQQRIHFLSNISNYELAQLYESCVAYVSATLFEGLGMPIIEAMYFNSSLLLSNIDVLNEVTKGKAMFFNPDSYQELSDIMLNFKKELNETRSYVLSAFSEKETSQKYIDLINSMLIDVDYVNE